MSISYPPPAPKKKTQARALEELASSVAPDNDLDPNVALQELRATLRALMRSQALIEIGLDGFIRYASEAYARLSGYDADELIGKHYSTLFEPAFS